MIKIITLTIFIFHSLDKVEEHNYFFTNMTACEEMGERITRVYRASPRNRPHISWDCLDTSYEEVN